MRRKQFHFGGAERNIHRDMIDCQFFTYKDDYNSLHDVTDNTFISSLHPDFILSGLGMRLIPTIQYLGMRLIPTIQYQ